MNMTVKEAVVACFSERLRERSIRANELAICSGITPYSVYSMHFVINRHKNAARSSK